MRTNLFLGGEECGEKGELKRRAFPGQGWISVIEKRWSLRYGGTCWSGTVRAVGPQVAPALYLDKSEKQAFSGTERDVEGARPSQPSGSRQTTREAVTP
jgi:hypothetical protein